MFKIGEFSKLSRISIRMLRHYDEIGLLVPEETDPWTGYRRYAAAQLMTANRITALRGLGFSLAETAALLACWGGPDRHGDAPAGPAGSGGGLHSGGIGPAAASGHNHRTAEKG